MIEAVASYQHVVVGSVQLKGVSELGTCSVEIEGIPARKVLDWVVFGHQSCYWWVNMFRCQW